MTQTEERLEHFQRMERLQNRRAEIAIGLLRQLQRNPNLLSGRRRVRKFLREHWKVLMEPPILVVTIERLKK